MPKTDSSPSKTEKLYLLTGEVDSRRDVVIQQLVSQLVDPGSEAFDLERLEGDEISADRIFASVMTAPLASESKVVIVNRVDRLDPSEQVKLAGFIPKLGPRCCLILTVGDEESSRKRQKSSSAGSTKAAKPSSGDDEDDDDEEQPKEKRRKGLQPEITKAAKQYGSIVTFAKMRAQDVSTLVAKAVKDCKKKINPVALQNLARMLAAGPGMIESEVEKLATYVGDRDEITLQDVEDVVTESPEDRVFPLIDAIAAHRPAEAIRLLNDTLEAGVRVDGDVLRILSMLAGHFRKLYQTRFVMSRGVRHLAHIPEELAQLLPEKNKSNILSLHQFQQRKLPEQAASFSEQELRTAMAEILACEIAVKGLGRTEGSPRLNLETLVFKLCRRGRH